MKRLQFCIVNAITLSRPFLVAGGCWFLQQQNWFTAWWMIVGGMLLTDMIDGPLARKWQVTSKLGATLDLAFDVLAFWILIVSWYIYAQRNIPFAQAWINPQHLLWYGLGLVWALVLGDLLLRSHQNRLPVTQAIKGWYVKRKGDFIVGVTIDAVIILWIASHISWEAKMVTVGCGIVAIYCNAEKVSGFFKSALFLRGEQT